MIVKMNDGQLSFLFQEADPFFEIGYKILEQANIEEMLSYTRIQQKGHHKISFICDEEFVPLSRVVEGASNNDIIDILYEIIFLTQKVEENGFLKKECIWFNYDHVYYDVNEKKPKVAILPITREFRYADGLNWYGRFEDTIMNIAQSLPKAKVDKIKMLIRMYRNDKLTCEEVLGEINTMGSGMSGLLVNRTDETPDVELQLIYSGREGRIEFNILEEEYVIGKNPKIVNGVVPENISRAVSRRHCMVTKINKKYFVQDLDSSNHTLVNGIMIPAYELMELTNSDILSVADVEFRVNLREVS